MGTFCGSVYVGKILYRSIIKKKKKKNQEQNIIPTDNKGMPERWAQKTVKIAVFFQNQLKALRK